jgi:hypothetical protein
VCESPRRTALFRTVLFSQLRQPKGMFCLPPARIKGRIHSSVRTFPFGFFLEPLIGRGAAARGFPEHNSLHCSSIHINCLPLHSLKPLRITPSEKTYPKQVLITMVVHRLLRINPARLPRPSVTLSAPSANPRLGLLQRHLAPTFTSPSIPSPQHQSTAKMSSQAAHATLLIPGPIEFHDDVLNSMAHHRSVIDSYISSIRPFWSHHLISCGGISLRIS